MRYLIAGIKASRREQAHRRQSRGTVNSLTLRRRLRDETRSRAKDGDRVSGWRFSSSRADHPRSPVLPRDLTARDCHRPRPSSSGDLARDRYRAVRHRAWSRECEHARMPCNLHSARWAADGETYFFPTCETENVNKKGKRNRYWNVISLKLRKEERLLPEELCTKRYW